jgi:hypothetical protein
MFVLFSIYLYARHLGKINLICILAKRPTTMVLSLLVLGYNFHDGMINALSRAIDRIQVAKE